MLGNDVFYFHTIKKVTTAFGYIFDDISIERINPSTSAVQTIKVPISQAAKEKWSVREAEDPNAGDEPNQRHVQIVLPRMSYDLVDFQYDSKRKLPAINYRVAPTGNGPSAYVQLNPIPYIFNYELTLQTRTLSDSFAIVEQILAFFRPDYTVPIIDIEPMNYHRDIVITLNSTSHSDSYEGNFLDKRIIEWNFNFQAQAFIYPPIKTNPVIKTANVDVLEIGDTNGGNINIVADPDTANLDDSYNIVITYNVNYFVDPINGNDTNNGLSVTTAWKTTSQADNILLSGTQAIYYFYDDTWVLYRKLGMTMDEMVLPLDLVTFEFSSTA
jgi:hypothetical protein